MGQYVTACGLYCGACSSMLMYEKQNGVSDAAHFICEFNEEPCSGCGRDERTDCEFIRCCREHGVELCAFCAEFPCEMITNFSRDEWPHHIDAVNNLSRIREAGIEAWLAEQHRLWSCPGCGGRTHWYQKKCHTCGTGWDPRYGG